MFRSFLRFRHIFVLALGFLCLTAGFARPTDEIPAPGKRVSGPVTPPLSASAAPALPTSVAVNQRMQTDLDAALSQLNQRLDAQSAIVPDALTNLPVTVSEQAADERTTARRLMTYPIPVIITVTSSPATCR